MGGGARLRSICLVALFVFGLAAAPAFGARVEVSDMLDTRGGDDDFADLSYAAAAGEVNNLVVTQGSSTPAGQTLIVTDSGATITAGSGCTSVNAHRATCFTNLAKNHKFASVDAELGDRNDRADVSAVGAVGNLFGGPGSDILAGSSSAPNALYGDDVTPAAGDAADVVVGGGDDDFIDPGAGRDAVTGGGGEDLVTYRNARTPVTVDLSKPLAPAGVAGEADILRGIEDVEGGDGNDKLTGDGGRNKFEGSDGSDTLDGGGGQDTVSYDSHVGSVRVDLSKGRGGEKGETDSLSNFENIEGALNNDVLIGNGAPNTIHSSSGADHVSGRGGNDRLFGDGGDFSHGDRISGGAGDDLLAGSDANDRLRGNAGRDRLLGRAGNDRLVGGPGKDRFSGGFGKDRINSLDGRRERVGCDRGRDWVKADLNDRLSGCEVVTRLRF